MGFEPTPLARRGPEPRALDRSATMSLMTITEQKLILFVNLYTLQRSSRGKQPLTRVSAIAKTPHAQPRATQRAPPIFSWYLRRPPRSARHRARLKILSLTPSTAVGPTVVQAPPVRTIFLARASSLSRGEASRVRAEEQRPCQNEKVGLGGRLLHRPCPARPCYVKK